MNLSYNDILLVVSNDEDAVKKLIAAYEGYINTLCYSNVTGKLDIDEKQELLLALVLAVRKFRIE
ncbi:MAG: helix-turn-helix domain-containing protein [Ruminococcus flavefaciens]|nr:helix-turn-helix domain-containing protein [Ruminococcus flavefaciens]